MSADRKTTLAGFILILLVCTFAWAEPAPTMSPMNFRDWAQTPPMGWNSWDCFGAAVTEEQVKANADYMADKLAEFGWQYVVVDIQWYEPGAWGHDYRKDAQLVMDDYGRLLPAANRFPSAQNGKGFKPLADYVHGKGLKFGIHLMRGIPRQAVSRNTPILGTLHRAADIADKNNVCAWNPDMYGVDMSKPGAQEYYNSVFELIASWDVDFVKVDDLSAPQYQQAEVEAIRRAIDRTGRPMVLSTSPGPTPLQAADHVAAHANMWRISNDFWDDWNALKEQFDRCRLWAQYSGPGHWPDADMLPFGAVRQQRPDGWTRFTPQEQIVCMTLWAICRSPLMMGGHLPKNDAFTLSLLTNRRVLAVNQHGRNPRQLFRRENLVAWVSDTPDGQGKYLALFNLADRPPGGPKGLSIAVRLQELGFVGPCFVEDLWNNQPIGTFSDEFAPTVPFHGAVLFCVRPDQGT